MESLKNFAALIFGLAWVGACAIVAIAVLLWALRTIAG
jgi:hypothetical protein